MHTIQLNTNSLLQSQPATYQWAMFLNQSENSIETFHRRYPLAQKSISKNFLVGCGGRGCSDGSNL